MAFARRSLSKALPMLLAGILLGGLPALAAEYPISNAPLDSSTQTTDPGASVTIGGSGYAPGTEIVVTIESTPLELARVDADAQGAFSITVTIPSDFPPGSHALKATGASATGGTLVLAAPISVSGELPFTGVDPQWLVLAFAALAAITAGTLIVRAARR